MEGLGEKILLQETRFSLAASAVIKKKSNFFNIWPEDDNRA
tara:strand:- start:101 stop:223 length:123 start_codon:yes stop_codon:yes gene_type:complete